MVQIDMAAAGLSSIWRTAPAPALRVVSVHGIERRGTHWSTRDATLLKQRRPYLPTTLVIGCGTKRTCVVQAVETSSRPKGAGKRPFVEPQWLFSSTEGDNLQRISEGENLEGSTSGRSWSQSQTENLEQSDALYYIVISTAKDVKSGLSEPNSGILLSMIGESGKAIMQRIPGSEESRYLRSGEAKGMPERSFRFQRGAVDVVTVVGPDLGRLAAIWIAPQAGTWRLEKASVIILPSPDKLVINYRLSSRDVPSVVISDELKESASTGEWKAIFHVFPSSEALLGDGAWLGAAELKPSSIRETSNIVDLQEELLKVSSVPQKSTLGIAKLREESMKEYENLKMSLLGFSCVLVVAGSASLAALGQGKLAEGFAVGGVGGFFYLLRLQRAVDQLPGSTTASLSGSQSYSPVSGSAKDNNSTPRQPVEGEDGEEETGATFQERGQASGNVETSSLRSILSGTGDIGLRERVALVAGVALLLGRFAGGGAVSTISPPELLAGIFGFLTSKVAVVLAALKPSSSSDDK